MTASSTCSKTPARHKRGQLPPYDIAKLGEDAYRIVLAVAGFGEDELTITHQPNMLVIEGAKTENDEV